MNILFLCTANRDRSRTAEDYFRPHFPKHHFRSAGMSKFYCEKENTTYVSKELLEWADRIYAMELKHLDAIHKMAGDQYDDKTIILHIEDNYQYMDKVLIDALKLKLEGKI